MIKRVYSADFINSVINDPSVKEGAEIKGIADMSVIAADLRNHILVNEHGGFVVIKRMEGIYECHTQFLPEGRGQAAFQAVEEAMRYMFIETDCQRIITKVNVNNKPVRMFAGRFFRKRGTVGDYCYYSRDLDEWIETDGHCLVKGRLFHTQIEDDQDNHDATLNCFVGAALLMAQSSNVYKGQLAYNRWAVMAGYEPIIVLSEAPLMMRNGAYTIAIQNNEVKLCPLH
jgi:hypothetical protein